jgi:hypothetical protein
LQQTKESEGGEIMDKIKYLNPEMEISLFNETDVIKCSASGTPDDEFDE